MEIISFLYFFRDGRLLAWFGGEHLGEFNGCSPGTYFWRFHEIFLPGEDERTNFSFLLCYREQISTQIRQRQSLSYS